jgi:alkylated DNA repair dioxygenase AlkB
MTKRLPAKGDLVIRHTPIVEDSDGCFVALYEHVLSPEKANWLLNHLHTHIPFKVETDAFGQQSRPTYYVGDDNCVFTYVGLRLEPNEWTDELLQARTTVEQACQVLPSSALTACLLNLYLPGQGFIPWHYDEVRAHGTEAIVAALSLGGPRRFQLRKRNQTEEPTTVIFDQLLQPGSLLVMKGSKTQEFYEHSLPLETDNDKGQDKDSDNDSDAPPLRISLTFRSIVPGYEQDRDIATDKCCT